MFLQRKRIEICKFIRPCDLHKIRGNVKSFQTFFEHQDDKGIPVQAFEIFPRGVNIKSEITKNVSGKIPVFRILFNIPTIFFDVLRGIVGVCVLLTPRNDIIGSSIKKLRRIAEDNLGTVAVYCGNRFMIIRPKFEEFISGSSEI